MSNAVQMVQRSFWKAKIEAAWEERSVVWLSGVRRSGKTFLCLSLPDVEYFDCELPRIRRRMEDPESFLDSLGKRRVVVDEVHRLPNAAELLKIAADHYPGIRVVATGSSTLGASSRFRDTLAGRKRSLWLTPMASPDLEDFSAPDLRHRFLRGGLPPFFLASVFPEADFQDWMDSFWSKDIAELFRLERRSSFEKFFELLISSSGGIFQASRFARPCEVSRNTIANYLAVLEATHVAHVVRPFSGRNVSEIVAAPKVYGFDTGFVCYHKGWEALRNEDLGLLWEHYVLNELQAVMQLSRLNYWRDKKGHEVDFVLALRGKPPVAIECKWRVADFDPSGLSSFRKLHPKGDNFLVASDVKEAHIHRFKDVFVRVVGLPALMTTLRDSVGAEAPSDSRQDE